ncbi:transglutaminase family protein [Oleiphilus messinensis]|uniref:transglutaminase family protein n=1 Tax=Oleiphilus messinensis TaxID=141451 RepID=UPI001E3817FA|nr:transglutaminase family protein [Oleiphilus messinensis]
MNTNTSSMRSPSPDYFGSHTLLRVRHETVYRYPGAASLAYNMAWLTPLNDPQQNCLQHRVKIDPKPRLTETRMDVFGNQCTYFEVHKPHDMLKVVSHAVVERHTGTLDAIKETTWEQCRYRELGNAHQRVRSCRFAYPGPITPALPGLAEYAQVAFVSERPIVEAIAAFTKQIFSEFSYQTGATHVDTPIDVVWQTRKGVCQDFAHIAVSGLRSIGLIAAYVSGYIVTNPPEGEEKLQGTDASHAWYAVFIPGYGWLHSDPTNDMWVRDEHITVALGRDYSDVPPLKGVCYGGGQQHPDVAVTVERISEEDASYGD